MNIANEILNPASPAYDTERIRIDRLARFLVIADMMPETGFRHYGLTGRMTRIGLQLGWSEDESHAEILRRYSSHLEMFKAHREVFLATTMRLRAEYGDAQLIRWGCLSPAG